VSMNEFLYLIFSKRKLIIKYGVLNPDGFPTEQLWTNKAYRDEYIRDNPIFSACTILYETSK